MCLPFLLLSLVAAFSSSVLELVVDAQLVMLSFSLLWVILVLVLGVVLGAVLGAMLLHEVVLGVVLGAALLLEVVLGVVFGAALLSMRQLSQLQLCRASVDIEVYPPAISVSYNTAVWPICPS